MAKQVNPIEGEYNPDEGADMPFCPECGQDVCVCPDYEEKSRNAPVITIIAVKPRGDGT